MDVSSRHRARACRFLAAALLLAATAPARSGNDLVNPRFDGSLDGWLDYGSTASADGGRTYAPFPEDASTTADSGSVQLLLAGSSAVGTRIGVSQCVSVAPNQTYNYGARFKQPAAQNQGSVRVMVDVMFYGDVACTAPLGGAEQGAVVGVAYPLSDTEWLAIPGSVPVSAGATSGLATRPATVAPDAATQQSSSSQVGASITARS